MWGRAGLWTTPGKRPCRLSSVALSMRPGRAIRMDSPKRESLSARQTEIAGMVAKGESSREIADALGLSPRAVAIQPVWSGELVCGFVSRFADL